MITMIDSRGEEVHIGDTIRVDIYSLVKKEYEIVNIIKTSKNIVLALIDIGRTDGFYNPYWAVETSQITIIKKADSQEGFRQP